MLRNKAREFKAGVRLSPYEQWLNVSLLARLQLCLHICLYSHGKQAGGSSPPPHGPSPAGFSDQPAAQIWGLNPAWSGPQLSSDQSFLISVCRPGWPRLKADSQPAATRPVGRVGCMRRRMPPRSTTARRIGRGTVSVQRLLGFFGVFFCFCFFLALYLLPNSGIRDEHEVLVRSHASVMTGLWFFPQCSCLMPRGWCWSLWGAGGPWLQRSGVTSTWLSRGLHSEPWLGPVAIVAVCFAFLSSPDGSYTEEQSQESEVKVLATDFDDEFDDEEPLPAIGTCKALYTFEGNTDCLRPSSFCGQTFF